MTARLHLLIDGQGIQGEGRRRGVGRYARELVAGIARARPHWRVRLAVSAHQQPADPIPGVEAVRYTPPAPVAFADGPATPLLRLHYGDWLRAERPDAVLVLSPFEPNGLPVGFAGGGPPHLAVFYDLIPLLFPAEYMTHQDHLWRFFGRQVRQCLAADRLLAISEATRVDLAELVGAHRADNIRGAAASDLPPVPPAEARRLVAALFARTGVADAGRGFLLYVGGGDFRKNLAGLFAGYAALPRAVRAGRPLVVAGAMPDNIDRDLRGRAAELGITESVALLGYVSEAELAALYQTTRVFAFPSLYEGLGLPVLEALSYGADVATTDTSSVPEFSGPGTDYFDPADPAAIARTLYRVLARPAPTDPAAKRAFAAGFTWDRTAEAAGRAIEATVANPPPPPAAERVVWRRSFPADTTAADLLLFAPTLAAGRPITLLHLPGDPPPPAAVAARVRVRTPDELLRAEELAPTAAHVYELDTPADLAVAAPWLVRRPGLLVVSAALARSGVWADERFAAGRRAADRVLVRGLAAGEPLPPGFAAAARDDARFDRLLADTAALGRRPDRQWRTAAVAALTRHPMPDRFVAEWAALWAAGQPAAAAARAAA